MCEEFLQNQPLGPFRASKASSFIVPAHSGMHLGKWQLLKAYGTFLQNQPRVPPGPLVETLGPGLYHGSPRIFPQPVLPFLCNKDTLLSTPYGPHSLILYLPTFPKTSSVPCSYGGQSCPHFLFFLQDPRDPVMFLYPHAL